MFRKILIANRGEIAVRILRACRELGVPAAVVYSDADRASLHVRLADEAYRLGPAPSRESYLAIGKILDAARAAGCDAVHPGYGFLAENHEFARACAAAGIAFIGPPPEAMAQLGSKTAARHLARQVGVPTVPGALDPIANLKLADATAKETGFPIVLKAVAGGGGKGMRLVEREAELAGAWRDATSEAENAFGDGRLYLEKYLPRPRHIEIQVLGDHHGHMVYLGERECSVQRRYQKVIEEAPSPVMDEDLRRAMGGIPVGTPKILLAHNPCIIRGAARYGADLVLSGHTHGGQINFPVIGSVAYGRSPERLRYKIGWDRLADTQIYVSRGLGTIVLPWRLRCPAEIPHIELLPSQPANRHGAASPAAN